MIKKFGLTKQKFILDIAGAFLKKIEYAPLLIASGKYAKCWRNYIFLEVSVSI
ncbi:hypothetical protein LEP1GSC202_0434 [Leptospira yanagawae serovar Saopaulo str. Sao Paulo = ATCC 700523]|uniref:Uncharacterized protein n=1 Tax=Leptospira yanagawae serovar Saopaulo str. Sao Paulo = ATCC 700523 TaxID=1249483 RepID=A0A5E8HJ62_9LEPT|nr:hypothetical protein LEP1GSC202_0434 [Leptospira yanagawae serovar Saopaulo str. Sao Paulo = ATCC 700523]